MLISVKCVTENVFVLWVANCWVMMGREFNAILADKLTDIL
jgi:hypothetical protein